MSAYKSGKSTSTGGSKNGGGFHLFVGGLGCNLDADQVKAYFERYAKVDFVKMVLNKDGLRRGCCSIRFAEEPSQELLDQFYSGHHMIEDRSVDIKPHEPNQQQLHQDRQEENARSVMIFNLHPDVRTEDLKIALEKAIGPVSKADVVVESNGKSRCFGHATFVNEKLATFAKSFEKLKIKGHNCTIREKKDRNEVKNSKECSGAHSVMSGPALSNNHYPNGSGASNHSVMSDQKSTHQSGKILHSAPSKNSGVHETNRHSMGFASTHSVGSYPDQFGKGPINPHGHPQHDYVDAYAGVSFEDMGMGGFYTPNGCDQYGSRSSKSAAVNYPHGGSAAHSYQMNLPKTVPRMPAYPGHPGSPAAHFGWQQPPFEYQDPRQHYGAYHGISPMVNPAQYCLGGSPYPSQRGQPQFSEYPGWHPPQMEIIPHPQSYNVNEGSNMRKSTGMASLGSDSRAQTAKSNSQMSDFPATSNGTYGKHLETTRELKKQNNLDSLAQSASHAHQHTGFSQAIPHPTPSRQGFMDETRATDPRVMINPTPKSVKHDNSSDSLDQLKGIFVGGCTPKQTGSAIQPPAKTEVAKPKQKGILETAACKMKQYCLWGSKKCDGKDPSQK